MSPEVKVKEKCSAYAIFVIIVAAFSGFLYGYHTGIISGALIFLTPAFNLSPIDQGMVVSAILIGGLIGAVFSGTLADKFGRRRTIAMTSTLFIGGAVMIALSNSYQMLLIGRIISGIGVGIISLAAPLYLAEVSPPHFRGLFVSLYQLFIALGILASYGINYTFAASADWRWMFAIGVFPAILQMLALFFVPDTPAWLFSQGRDKQALATVERLRKDKHWKTLAAEMKSVDKGTKVGRWKDLFSLKVRFILIVGFVLSALQQVTGINTVIFYAPKIFESAGFTTATDAIIASLSIALVNLLITAVAAWLLDKVGRRLLLLIGVAGMAVSLSLLSLAFFIGSQAIGTISIICLVGYVAFFAIGLGPITWVVNSEIFPLKIRGKAMTIAIFINWACNYLVSLTFLNLVDILGSDGTFFIYALISAFGFWFVLRFVPETKGKSLEEIELLVQTPLKRSGR